MKRVLVTGATTPPGSRIVSRLLADPSIEFVLATGVEPTEAREASAPPERYRYVPLDLSRPREVRALLFGPCLEHRVDTVVHGPLHRRTRDVGRRVHALDVESTREMFHLAQRHATVRNFVFRSSMLVYRVRAEMPTLVNEEHPLELSPRAPQWLRDRVEADTIACTHLGIGRLRVVVLRSAECLEAEAGSQLWDYLRSRVGFRPVGFDPMLNLVTAGDVARAVHLAVVGSAHGVFNIPGADTLPLTEAAARWGQRNVPAPGFLVGPLYALRSRVIHTDFRYDLNRWRFQYSAVPDGTRAREMLGYEPDERIEWTREPRAR